MDLSLTPQEEAEILEMFFFESQEINQQLNELLIALETTPSNHEIIDEIFRITHTLKGSAMGMGFHGIAELSHVIEDIFGEVKQERIVLDKNVFGSLFKANDKIGELIKNIKEKKKISHKGIKTKLEVILRKAREEVREDGTQAGLDNDSVMKKDANTLPEDKVSAEKIEQVSDDGNQPLESAIEADAIAEDSNNKSNKSNKLHNWFSKWIGAIQASISNTRRVPKSGTQAGETDARPESLGMQLASDDQSLTADFTEEAENVNRPDTSEMERFSLLNTKVEDRPAMTRDDVTSVKRFLDQVGDQDKPATAEDGVQDALAVKTELTDVVQVPIRKLDLLMNQVGQLIIERDRLMSINENNGARKAEYAGLQRITSDLQYSVMDVRLVQVGTLFSKFHRIARDVAEIEGKEINLKIVGSEVEIDRNILKIMSDSMVHLVRNAVGHGLETTQERSQSGKSAIGTITLSARNEKDNVVIEVSDDGKGIDAQSIKNKLKEKGNLSDQYLNQLSDEEIIMYIFETGFSGAARVSEVSGRGVGMDVVKRSTESIGGQVSVRTKVGMGTTISMKLPASMAVKGVLMFLMDHQEFAVALSYTEAVISLQKREIHKAGAGLISSYLKQTISIVFFKDLFYMKDFADVYDSETLQRSFDQYDEDTKFEVIVITYAGKYYGIVVDKLLQQKEIIEKPIPKPLDDCKLLSGTTILGNGNVCLIVDATSVTDILYTSKFKIQKHLNAS